mgnify:CR=1 FL=1
MAHNIKDKIRGDWWLWYYYTYLCGAGSAYDADAEAFFTASGITDTTTKDAVNQFVLDTKGGASSTTTNQSDLWTKAVAIWPMVQGNSATPAVAHAQDLKTTFDLTFINAPTFATTGITFNGTTQYAQTGLNVATSLSTHDVTLCACSNVDLTGNRTFMGARDASVNILEISNIGGTEQLYFRCYDNPNANAVSVSNGVVVGTARSSTDFELYRNGTSIDTGTTSTKTPPSIEMYIACQNNNGTPNFFFDQEMRGTAILSGVTDNEAQDLTDAFETLNDALSRGVIA